MSDFLKQSAKYPIEFHVVFFTVNQPTEISPWHHFNYARVSVICHYNYLGIKKKKRIYCVLCVLLPMLERF